MLVARKPLPMAPQPAPPLQKRKPRRQAARRNRGAVLRGGLVFAFTMILAFVAVAWQAQIVSARRRVHNAGANIARIEAQVAMLQYEVAGLSSTARIERVARERLQMDTPTDAQVMKVGVGTR